MVIENKKRSSGDFQEMQGKESKLVVEKDSSN
jgi:hypothetical protein